MLEDEVETELLDELEDELDVDFVELELDVDIVLDYKSGYSYRNISGS